MRSAAIENLDIVTEYTCDLESGHLLSLSIFSNMPVSSCC